MRCFVVPEGATESEQAGYAEIIAVHAALLRTGKIVYFSGDQHDPGQFAHGLFDQVRLFDCETFAVTQPAATPGITDLFCCGHAFLADGRLLIAGGTKRFDGFQGSPAAWIFDPADERFHRMADMHDGRWYPTLVALGSGEVVALSGTKADGSEQNPELELYGDSGWRVSGHVGKLLGTYPRAHLLPDGQLLVVDGRNGATLLWREGDAAPRELCALDIGPDGEFDHHTTVLLPLLHQERYAPRILLLDVERPKVLDVTTGVWQDTGPRRIPGHPDWPTVSPRRVNGMAVLLPTGDVLACGGELEHGDEARPVRELELYRPDLDAWATLPVATSVTRAYHSVALLMPDGCVWIAGSNRRCDWSFHDSADYPNPPEPTNPADPGVDNRELRIEIVEPWYVGRPDRPSFTLEVDEVSVGGFFNVITEQAPTIGRVALVRAGSTTHAFDADQRYVTLPFSRPDDVTLLVDVPDDSSLLPPGPYLVFVLDQVVDAASGRLLDVPSVGRWLRVTNA